jgi:hypothetical protein
MITNNSIKLGLYLIGCVIIFASLISAADVSVWQGQYYTGTTFNTGTYEFNFSVYDSLTGGNICFSNTTNLTTGNFGEWEIEVGGINSACNNVSKDYYLNININGVDQSPRRRLVIWNYLRKDVDEIITGNLILHGTLSGLSPLKFQDEINFIKAGGNVTSALYNAPRLYNSTLPSVFADSLIHDIIQETNDYGMQECFWDENTETMQMCISGAYLNGRATTVSRSFQVVGNTTNKVVNENFTLCEGNNYIDCDTDLTGADLLVEDDIEAIGSIYSQENVTASYFVGDGSLLTGVSGDNSSWNESYADTIYHVKNNSLQLGTQDAFGRNQIWNFMPSNILRLGSLASDGDATTVSSEGVVVYGENLNGDIMTSQNFSYARIKPNRIGLYSSINSVADYYFRVDENTLYLKNNSWVKTFEVARGTGNVNSQGNVSADYFVGDGSLLTGINSSSINLTNYALKNQSETFEGSITVNGDGNFSGTVYAHNFSGNSPVRFVSGNETLLVIEDSGVTFSRLINASEIVVSGNIETDLIKVKSGIKELTSSLALSKLDYAEDTANATLISQQDYALNLIEVNKNISLATLGESLELKKNRVITAAELAKSFIKYNSDVAQLKILEAKNLALLNILNSEDVDVIEAEAAARLVDLNLTAQQQSEIVEDALNDSLQEIEANDQEIRFCFSDGTNCNNTFVGNVSADYFVGDGSYLTGIIPLESDPYWTGNFTLYNSSWSLDTDTTYSHLSNFTNDLGIGNWTLEKPNYYLNSNPFGFYNSTTLPSAGSESDPYWTGNFTLYNFSWSSTYNSTYEAKANYQFLGNNFNGSGNFNTLGNVSSSSFIADGKVQGEYYSYDGSVGITSTTNYWLCTQANCKTSCQVQIKNGIITGCV